jgi:hypothetical protein
MLDNCPLSEVYLIHATFRELALLPFSGDCQYIDTFFRIVSDNVQHSVSVMYQPLSQTFKENH